MSRVAVLGRATRASTAPPISAPPIPEIRTLPDVFSPIRRGVDARAQLTEVRSKPLAGALDVCFYLRGRLIHSMFSCTVAMVRSGKGRSRFAFAAPTTNSTPATSAISPPITSVAAQSAMT